MKICLLFFSLILGLHAQDALVEKPDPSVAKSAVEAVDKLGQKVVAGKYLAAVDLMYPQWKERTAKKIGGMDKLEAKLERVAADMLAQGVSITEFKPYDQPKIYEVGMGKKVLTREGKEYEVLRYTKWLALVPTVTIFRAVVSGQPKPMIFQSKGFQVAIADKDKLDWTFIDGSSVTVGDLRSLFVNLPTNLEFPSLEKKQLK